MLEARSSIGFLATSWLVTIQAFMLTRWCVVLCAASLSSAEGSTVDAGGSHRPRGHHRAHALITHRSVAEIGTGGSMMRREKMENVAPEGQAEKPEGWEANLTTKGGDPGPCAAEICGAGHVLKPAGLAPAECRYTGHCSPEECCLGFCGGFIAQSIRHLWSRPTSPNPVQNSIAPPRIAVLALAIRSNAHLSRLPWR